VELGGPKGLWRASLQTCIRKSIHCRPNHSWPYVIWYKPESKRLGALLDRLAVMVGYYDFLPDRQFKNEGYRLEELVRSPHERSHIMYPSNNHATDAGTIARRTVSPPVDIAIADLLSSGTWSCKMRLNCWAAPSQDLGLWTGDVDFVTPWQSAPGQMDTAVISPNDLPAISRPGLDSYHPYIWICVCDWLIIRSAFVHVLHLLFMTTFESHPAQREWFRFHECKSYSSQSISTADRLWEYLVKVVQRGDE